MSHKLTKNTHRKSYNVYTRSPNKITHNTKTSKPLLQITSKLSNATINTMTTGTVAHNRCDKTANLSLTTHYAGIICLSILLCIHREYNSYDYATLPSCAQQ